MLKDVQNEYLDRIRDLLISEQVKEASGDELTWSEAERLLYEYDMMFENPTLRSMFDCLASCIITDDDKEKILRDHISEAFG